MVSLGKEREQPCMEEASNASIAGTANQPMKRGGRALHDGETGMAMSIHLYSISVTGAPTNRGHSLYFVL